MKKLMIICVFLSAFTFNANAQKGDLGLNTAAMAGLPTGDFGDAYGMGWGVSLKGLYRLNSVGQVTLSTGYSQFGLKDTYDENLKGSLGIIPVFAGYRHQLGELYLEPQLGLSVNRSNLKADFGDAGNLSGSASDTSFGYAASIGYLLGDVDLSLSYQGFSLSSQGLGFIGFRVGYQFKLN
ncbi:porin family protein [Echinicola vietnamensis]|uniref:Outer membrane protein beta-barrel domain-containing protein n=1 Tax=Echinicola vietnamensis (strain DSM 17526 / LMG 23754 / KMM 6221) TaxID=926556 RepID=L0FUN1_ECHVK|nr:porin family protein [Echinicola vietnamensis]AGA76738.1 hypothetical protein Echvi_0452 [Echinicola vietnamensis DSM 17526]